MTKKLKSKAGMTLLEIIAVIALLGLVVGGLATNVMDIFGGGKVKAAKLQIGNLEGALDIFSLECSGYPTTEQGLKALVSKPAGLDCPEYNTRGYVKKLSKDPWGQDLLYSSNGTDYEIRSKGPDKKANTEDDVSTAEKK